MNCVSIFTETLDFYGGLWYDNINYLEVPFVWRMQLTYFVEQVAVRKA